MRDELGMSQHYFLDISALDLLSFVPDRQHTVSEAVSFYPLREYGILKSFHNDKLQWLETREHVSMSVQCLRPFFKVKLKEEVKG